VPSRTTRHGTRGSGRFRGWWRFKLHILRRLLDSAPEPLTVSQIREGGPNRTDASAWYAMKALERIGVVASVPKTAQCRVVREFVTDRQQQELPPPLSPLPASPQYQQVLTVLCAPGRAEYQYRLKADAAPHARALLETNTGIVR